MTKPILATDSDAQTIVLPPTKIIFATDNGNKHVEEVNSVEANPMTKGWHRGLLIAAAVVGTLGLGIGLVAAGMHFGFIPEPTHLMHQFSISSSTLQIGMGATGGALMITGGGLLAGSKKRGATKTPDHKDPEIQAPFSKVNTKREESSSSEDSSSSEGSSSEESSSSDEG